MKFFDKNKLNTGSNGEFINEDEEKGINGTVVDAKLLNSLGNEIENIIKAGGMTPSENENDQLLRSIKNLGGSGVSSSAENVSYDSSISGLQQKNYDFPKIKSPIDNLTYIYLTENSIMGKIEKEENNYFLKGNVSVTSKQNILSISVNIDDKDGYEILSFLCQFFNIDYETSDIENVNWIDALENEIIINGINDGWQFAFVQNTINIKRKDNGEIPENTYSVTLSIKNRVLLKPDENIISWQYGISENILLKIVNKNGTAKIKGITKNYSYLRDTEWIFFTNNILENYIDLNAEHTSGIISSSGKNVIWSFKKNYQDLPYSIVIKYEDKSEIQENDFFTINITADKNADISFTKGEAVNVQNAIDSITEIKQDKLTAGENIVIEEQGEKTIIKSLGGGDAKDISFDNSKAQLNQLVDYDFPKFKTPIPDTINLVLTDNIKEYPATITKNEDGSYILNSSIDNYNIADTTPAIMLFVKSIDGNSNSYQMYSTFSQFFEFSDNNNFIFYNLEKEECNISNTNINFKVSMIMANIIGIMLIKEDETEFEQGNYNIILNIKNRVLKNEDANLFVSNSSNLYTLSFINDNGNIKLTGKITTNGKYTTTELLGFYSPIIENYFNLSSILGNTVGITSSSGKALKFCVIKGDASNNNLALYMFSIAYQDGSNIQEGDVFTFNLTPDKNSTLDPIYSSVSNVQEAIEAIVQRLILLESYNKNIEGV